MAAITSQWWRHLVNAYEMTTVMMCLHRKNCVILSASEMSFSRRDVIQIYAPFLHSDKLTCFRTRLKLVIILNTEVFIDHRIA